LSVRVSISNRMSSIAACWERDVVVGGEV